MNLGLDQDSSSELSETHSTRVKSLGTAVSCRQPVLLVDIIFRLAPAVTLAGGFCKQWYFSVIPSGNLPCLSFQECICYHRSSAILPAPFAKVCFSKIGGGRLNWPRCFWQRTRGPSTQEGVGSLASLWPWGATVAARATHCLSGPHQGMLLLLALSAEPWDPPCVD